MKFPAKIAKAVTSITVLLLISIPSSYAQLVTVTGVPRYEPLYDISGHKYEEAIRFLYDLKIISGYNDNSFKADNSINRAELLKIVVEANFEDEFEAYTNQNCFSDVPPMEWYTKYVCFAKDRGIIVGFEDGTFRPAQTIAMVEALKLVIETFGHSYKEAQPWYRDIVDEASSKNLIPFDIPSFQFGLTRGQMSDMITRFIKFNDETLADYLDSRAQFSVTYHLLQNFINLESSIQNSFSTQNVLIAKELQDGFVEGSDEYQIAIYDPETDSEKSFGTIQTHQNSNKLIYKNADIYFLNPDGELAIYNIFSKKTRLVNIPDETIYDFLLEDGKIYYLQGECADSGECNLKSYNPDNQDQRTILMNIQENIETILLDSISLLSFDPDFGIIELANSSGDAGRIVVDIYDINVNLESIVKADSFTFQNCEILTEEEKLQFCGAEVQAENKRYHDKFTHPDCPFALIEISNSFAGILVDETELQFSKFIQCLEL